MKTTHSLSHEYERRSVDSAKGPSELTHLQFLINGTSLSLGCVASQVCACLDQEFLVRLGRSEQGLRLVAHPTHFPVLICF